MDSTLSEKNDLAIAAVILENGWRQGSIINLNNDIVQLLPFAIDRNEEQLIIASQSCSVVSNDFKKDPQVEVMTIKNLIKYNQVIHEATGKNQRKIHLPLINNDNFQAIECDIYRRCFIDRKIFSTIFPNENFIMDMKETKKLAAWLGRNYTRTALPNSLAVRAKIKKGLFEIVQKILKEEYSGQNLHSSISHVYLKWNPDIDDDNVELYSLYFIFICKNAEISDKLERILDDRLKEFISPTGKDGIKIVQKCAPLNEIYLSDLEGYERFSEYDYFTSLNEISDYQ